MQVLSSAKFWLEASTFSSPDLHSDVVASKAVIRGPINRKTGRIWPKPHSLSSSLTDNFAATRRNVPHIAEAKSQ